MYMYIIHEPLVYMRVNKVDAWTFYFVLYFVNDRLTPSFFFDFWFCVRTEVSSLSLSVKLIRV